jgi:hypothetical protein
MIPGTASFGTISSPFPTPNGVTIVAGQSNAPTSLSWNSSVIPTLTQSLGVNQYHGCLLARVYPLGSTPDTGDLTGYPSSDPHYAQHNCVVTTAATGAMFSLPIRNGNLSRAPLSVAVHATPDLKPSPLVLKAITPGLHLVRGYKRIATTPLPRPVLDLTAFKGVTAKQVEPLKAETVVPAAAIKAEHAMPVETTIKAPIEMTMASNLAALESATLKAGGVAATTLLPPQHFAKFNFSANLQGSTVGDAHVWHISQVTSTGQPYGGLTVVIVVT